MKGLSFNFSAIIGVFVPLSFYCCLSGTIITLCLFAVSLKFEDLKSPVRKLAFIFAFLWLLNIIASFYAIFISPTSLSFMEIQTTTLTYLIKR